MIGTERNIKFCPASMCPAATEGAWLTDAIAHFVSRNCSPYATETTHPDLGRSEPRRMALHRAGQTHAERLHRARQELQAFC